MKDTEQELSEVVGSVTLFWS